MKRYDFSTRQLYGQREILSFQSGEPYGQDMEMEASERESEELNCEVRQRER